jgi:hypothetical protein
MVDEPVHSLKSGFPTYFTLRRGSRTTAGHFSQWDLPPAAYRKRHWPATMPKGGFGQFKEHIVQTPAYQPVEIVRLTVVVPGAMTGRGFSWCGAAVGVG